MASPDTDQNDAPRGYVENPNHVPNPTDMYGTLETSGTGGAAQGRIEEVTPIFDVAKAADLDTSEIEAVREALGVLTDKPLLL